MNPYQFYDSYEEGEYRFGDKIDNLKLQESLDQLSVVSYRYIELQPITDYHFSQTCFDNRDIVAYFSFMKRLTSTSFNDLFDNREAEWHLNPTYYQKQKSFRELVNKSLGLTKNLAIENTPNFYHFALYTTGNASKETGIKSPRVYFFFGKDATIFPLFYDPYHEINPVPNR